MGGIFAAYFAVGILIVLGFKSLAGIGSLSTSWIYRAVGIIAIALGIFNLKDFAWYGGGGFKLEVPESWRPRMKKIIGSVVQPHGAFVVGLIVRVFLLPCALGPYFVASGLLAGIPLGYALGWLVLYNVVFILPMLTITFVVYGGFGAITNIEEWRQKHLRTLHLVAGVILCCIGAAIVVGWIQPEHYRLHGRGSPMGDDLSIRNRANQVVFFLITGIAKLWTSTSHFQELIQPAPGRN